ncbi:glutamate synthase [Mesorhizobium sp. Root552]|uniref:FAD-dependent oxidoreductase n=1 Tax=Mesorhizobium sp. Root552 TaxID=1736555 RepID=UPI0006FF02B7|nr:NAD(P)/FAD-dependent oxidoreductase [Mesorhizobium sp. Root552]KQZ19110.1 glutamate synthase [Mesorhizobium sp. Root552]
MGGKLEIAICGAGPAGLAAALYLKRAGHRVTIFEKFDKVAPVGSGLILQPTGLTVLHDLGLFGQIMDLGSRIDRLHGIDATSGRTVLDVRYGALAGGRFGLAVHRSALFGVLETATRREGLAIETGVDVEGLDVGERAMLICTDGRRIGPFDLIIDATGARSRLRHFADAPCEPTALAYGAFWASLDWRGEGFDERALLQRYDKASVMVGVLPIGSPKPGAGRMAAFFWSLKPETAQQVQAAGIEAWKERIVRLWPECEAFTEQIDGFDQLTLARYGHHTMKVPAGRRLAVIGDAAHSTSPQLGQGANMALLDAAALARALGSSKDVEAALTRYARTRRRHVRVFQMLSRMFTPFYQSDSTLLPFLRDRLVATLATIPPAPQILAALVAGTVVDPFEATGLAELDWRAHPAASTEAKDWQKRPA